MDNVTKKWFCPKCRLDNKSTNTKKDKKTEYSEKISTFSYRSKEYLLFENGKEIRNRGFQLEDFVKVICFEKKRPFLYVELNYFIENNQDSIPLPAESIDHLAECQNCNKRLLQYCLFYPENPKELSDKLILYKKRNSKKEMSMGKALEQII